MNKYNAIILYITYRLDCDPGHDDAMAAILAWRYNRSGRLCMLGASTCAGNQTIDKGWIQICPLSYPG